MLNRAERRRIERLKSKNKNKKHQSRTDQGISADNAQEILDNMSPAQMAAGINNLIKQIENRGIDILDYDNKCRKLYKIQMIRGRYYFLAADSEAIESI